MFFEYIQLTGMGGASFSLDFLSRVLFLVVAGIVLTVIGFKIKGVWGAGLALAAGVALLSPSGIGRKTLAFRRRLQ